MSKANETKIRGEIQRLVSDYYTRLEVDSARRAEAQRRRRADDDAIAFVAGVIVGATVAAAHATRRP